jgi:hypothetical protein
MNFSYIFSMGIINVLYIFYNSLKAKKNIIPALNLLSTTQCRHMREWMYSSSIDLDTWRWVLGFTPPGNESPVPTRYDVGWVPVSVFTLWRSEKSLASAENRTQAVQLVARRYTELNLSTPNMTITVNKTQHPNWKVLLKTSQSNRTHQY